MAAKGDDGARRNELVIGELLKEDANKHCADCGQRGTRWASWNLGVFLCIRCGGLHRRLGTHISRVKSVNLDKWTDEQVAFMVANGNAKVNATYNPDGDRHPFPAYSGDMEQYIRNKYERKVFMSSDGAVRRSAAPPAAPAGNRAAAPAASRAPEDSAALVALADMGFACREDAVAALQSTGGNLQRAIEILVSAAKTPPPPPPSSSPGGLNGATAAASEPDAAVPKFSTKDDLESIFGVAQLCSALPTAACADAPAPGEAGSSTACEDEEDFTDFAMAPPPAAQQARQMPAQAAMPEEGAASSFYANGADLSALDDHRRGRGEGHGGREHARRAPLEAAASLVGSTDRPSIVNPWASPPLAGAAPLDRREGGAQAAADADAFCDIDPFKDFHSPTSSRR